MVTNTCNIKLSAQSFPSWRERTSKEQRAARQAAELVGRSAEQLVCQHLEEDGWHPVAVRARTRWGELDLVMRRGRTIAFVEVKAGSDASLLQHRVSSRQQHRLRRAAVAWIATNSSQLRGVTRFRFDVALVTLSDGRPVGIDHVVDAF